MYQNKNVLRNIAADFSEGESDTGDEVDGDSESGSDAEFNEEFRKYKANYYTEKMDFKCVTQLVMILLCIYSLRQLFQYPTFQH